MRVMRILLPVLALVLTVSCGPREVRSTVNAGADVERQIDQLLAKMTLAEKIGQMNQVSAGGDVSRYAESLRNGQVGSIPMRRSLAFPSPASSPILSRARQYPSST